MGEGRFQKVTSHRSVRVTHCSALTPHRLCPCWIFRGTARHSAGGRAVKIRQDLGQTADFKRLEKVKKTTLPNQSSESPEFSWC